MIRHLIRQLKHKIYHTKTKNKRSSQWDDVRYAFAEKNQTCAVCKSDKKLQIHHCVPFHHDSSLELDPENLISLCMDKFDCHIQIGHGDNFKFYNENVRQDAEMLINTPADQFNTKFKEVAATAKKNRKVN